MNKKQRRHRHDGCNIHFPLHSFDNHTISCIFKNDYWLYGSQHISPPWTFWMRSSLRQRWLNSVWWALRDSYKAQPFHNQSYDKSTILEEEIKKKYNHSEAELSLQSSHCSPNIHEVCVIKAGTAFLVHPTLLASQVLSQGSSLVSEALESVKCEGSLETNLIFLLSNLKVSSRK